MYNLSNSLYYDLFTPAEHRDGLTEIEGRAFLLQLSPSLLGSGYSPTSIHQWASHILDLIKQIRNNKQQTRYAIIINRDLLKFFLYKNSSNFEEAQQKLQKMTPGLIMTTIRVIAERHKQLCRDLKHVLEHQPQQNLNGLTPDNLFSSRS